VGTTFLAAEAAAYLSSAGGAVVAVDLDLHRGALHYRLDVPLSRETFTVLDLLPVLEDLSERVLYNALSSCPCGALLLPAPNVAAEHLNAVPASMDTLIDALAARFDYVVVDTGASLDDVSLSAAGAADLLVMVITPEIASLGGARRALDTLVLRAVSTPVSLVVNRSLGASDDLRLSDIESFLGSSVTVVLPEDPAKCRRAADGGLFLSCERSPLGEGIRALMGKYFH
jgi:MinD-like ATPase involved in chromosome partitioning or flagellar assembly